VGGGGDIANLLFKKPNGREKTWLQSIGVLEESGGTTKGEGRTVPCSRGGGFKTPGGDARKPLVKTSTPYWRERDLH